MKILHVYIENRHSIFRHTVSRFMVEPNEKTMTNEFFIHGTIRLIRTALSKIEAVFTSGLML